MTSDDELISSNNIRNISVKVTEKISSKYLKEFIKTSIEVENLTLELDSKVFVSFIQENLTYEIYILQSSLKAPLYIYKIFTTFYDDTYIKSIDLFITKEFFTVYKNGKFYFSKNNQEYTKDDILNYISFNYKIKIDNVYTINEENIKDLKEKYLKTNQAVNDLNYISFETNDRYKYFLLYLVILLSLSSYIFYDKFITQKQNIPNNQIQKLQSYKVKYKKMLKSPSDKKKITKDIIEFFSYLKIYQIYIIKMDYNKNIKSTIVSTTKDKLYNFLSTYDKKTKVISIKKDEKNNKYFMELQIEI